jgi:hypothetical protein
LGEDVRLVKEVLNGNIDSVNILIAKYEKTIYRFVYNIINDKETSQDITQEVFITMYNKLYTYRQDSKFSNWIFKIVSGVNVTIQNLTLANGNASYGGAIYNNGTLTVSDCIFINNKATALGGAI